MKSKAKSEIEKTHIGFDLPWGWATCPQGLNYTVFN